MPKKITAGECSLKASQDTTRIDPLEVAHAYMDDIQEGLEECISEGIKHIDEDEFCIILIIAGDCMIHNLRRHKFAYYPFLPKPRPQQVVFHYRKSSGVLKRLWSLPDAKVMATISSMEAVHPRWLRTKIWCDAFFNKNFHEVIREETGITLETEKEFLEANREELLQATAKNVDPSSTEPFYFSNVLSN